MKQPAVFLDRDGTLVEEVNYLSRVEEVCLFRSTAEAVRLLKDNGFLLVVVTNQSGIGRGIYDETAMASVHDEIQRQLGGAIDAFYFCPHLPSDGCSCRKPNRGMIDAACADRPIDLERSWIIGDKDIDVLAGKTAGLSTILVLTGYGASHQASLQDPPDHIVADILEAAWRITDGDEDL